ncbi:MAG: kinase-like domain-containing protein [Piptocephalis tieghemiana]|nr:MAG: kinase-like domain-containing protein [Piptocephalis tieghemiana]
MEKRPEDHHDVHGSESANVDLKSYFTRGDKAPIRTDGRLLGKGSFGKVYEGEWSENSGAAFSKWKKVAIKATLKSANKEGRLTFMSEMEGAMLTYPKAPKSTLRVLDVYLDHPTHWILVLEYAEYNLLSYLKAHTAAKVKDKAIEKVTRQLSEEEILRVFFPLFRASRNLSKSGELHADIKPENILLVRESDKLRPKLADFGLYRSKRYANFYTMQAGTPRYFPLEYLKRTNYKINTKHIESLDAYALILTLHECLMYPARDYLLSSDRGYKKNKNPADMPFRTISEPLRLLLRTVLTPGAWYKHPLTIQDLEPYIDALPNSKGWRS